MEKLKLSSFKNLLLLTADKVTELGHHFGDGNQV